MKIIDLSKVSVIKLDFRERRKYFAIINGKYVINYETDGSKDYPHLTKKQFIERIRIECEGNDKDSNNIHDI